MMRNLRLLSAVLLVSFIFEQASFAAGDLKPQEFDLFEKPLIHFKLPESIASFEDAYKAPGSKDLVYLIQDAHTNESGQINLAKTLDTLLKEEDLGYIFVEAGTGNDSLSFLRKYSSLEKRKTTAMSYLKKGILHGEEYLDLTSDRSFQIWGVENMALYQKTIESYRGVVKEREKFQTYLKRVGATINTLKPNLFNPALLSFSEQNDKFLKNELSLTDYFQILTNEAQRRHVKLSSYPHLQRMNKLKEKESNIDFKQANEEQKKAIQSLPAGDRQELLDLSKKEKSPFKLGSGEQKEDKAFYVLLEEKLADNSGIYKELFKYFDYLKEAKKLDPKEILREKNGLEQDIFNTLAGNTDEKNLLRCQMSLRLLEKLFNFTLTPEEFTEYKVLTQDFGIAVLTGFLNKKIMDLGRYYERAVFLEAGYDKMVENSEVFYNLTKDRDEAFLENMFVKMTKESQTKAVLITGGFHTPNLKSLLKSKNVSFISITPQVFQETNQKRYESLLLKQKVNPNLLANTPPMQHMARILQTWDGGYFSPVSREFGIPEQELSRLLAAFPNKPGEVSVPVSSFIRQASSLREAISRTPTLNPDNSASVSIDQIGFESEDGSSAMKQGNLLMMPGQALADRRRRAADIHRQEALSRATTFEGVERVQRAHDHIYEVIGARLASRRDFLKTAGLAAGAVAVYGPSVYSQGALSIPAPFVPNIAQTPQLIAFLTGNVTPNTKMPLSYQPQGPAYWRSIGHRPDNLENIVERLLTNNSVNAYDMSMWGMVHALWGDLSLANGVIARLNSGRSGELATIRGGDDSFTYNGRKMGRLGWFFRMIADIYVMIDPMDGKRMFPGFPDPHMNGVLHHVDWKPIMGENAWVILSAVQSAFKKYSGNVPMNSPEMQLALSLLDATEAMQSPIGGIYHAPEGTDGKDPRDISNENNFSMYAALKMLYEVVKGKDAALAARILRITTKQEAYFKTYAFNAAENVFYQGGLYVNGRFVPNKTFAVDCQTWGVAALGPEWITQNIGAGRQDTIYKIWAETKKRAGFFQNNILRGVGFTDGHEVQSSEWTLGAVLMARKASDYYRTINPTYAVEFANDANSMRQGVELLRVVPGPGRVSYKYSNIRTWIPFGWWANPIPCIAGTTWALMVDHGFDPLVLGGGRGFSTAPVAVAATPAATAVVSPNRPAPSSVLGTIPWTGAPYSGARWRSQAMDFRPNQDFSKAKEIVVYVRSATANTNIQVQLLDAATTAGTNRGVSNKINLRGPAQVVRIPISQFAGQDLKSIKQIAIHYGQEMVGQNLNADNSHSISIDKIEIVGARMAESTRRGFLIGIGATAAVVGAYVLGERSRTPSANTSNPTKMPEATAIKETVSGNVLETLPWTGANYNGDNWRSAAMDLTPNRDVSQGKEIVVHFRGASTDTNIRVQLLDVNTTPGAGDNGMSKVINLKGGEQVIRIPISEFAGQDLTKIKQIAIHYGEEVLQQPLNPNNDKSVSIEKIEVVGARLAGSSRRTFLERSAVAIPFIAEAFLKAQSFKTIEWAGMEYSDTNWRANAMDLDPNVDFSKAKEVVVYFRSASTDTNIRVQLLDRSTEPGVGEKGMSKVINLKGGAQVLRIPISEFKGQDLVLIKQIAFHFGQEIQGKQINEDNSKNLSVEKIELAGSRVAANARVYQPQSGVLLGTPVQQLIDRKRRGADIHRVRALRRAKTYDDVVQVQASHDRAYEIGGIFKNAISRQFTELSPESLSQIFSTALGEPVSHFFVQTVLAQGLTPSTLPKGGQIALLLDEGLGIFRFELQGNTLIVSAKGLDPVRLSVKNVQRDSATGRMVSASVNAADLMTLTRQWEANIRGELELAQLNTQVPVLVRVYLSLFPDFQQSSASFDMTVIDAANQARQNSRRRQGNVRFKLESSDPKLLALAGARLTELDVAYPNLGIAEAFVAANSLPGYETVAVAPPSEIILGSQFQIPSTPLWTGDIGTLALDVVVATPRAGIKQGGTMDPHYLAAARLATGNQDLASGVWADIALGLASVTLRIQNATKPLVRALDSFNQWTRMRLATLTAA